MSEKSSGKRGLGRGLGALIPTGPLPGAPGKGHFWNALDNPPIVDLDRVDPLAPTAEVDTATDRHVEQPVDNFGPETAGQTDSDSTIPKDAHSVDSETVLANAHDAGAAVALLIDVPVERVVPNPKQPRQIFDDDHIAELSHSVREFGLLQPIVVRQLPGSESFELVMGERRLRAAKLAGLTSVPAILRNTADDAMLRDALLENIHRVQLNPLEEAAAYEQLLVEFDVTHEQLASRIGRSRSQISNTIRLMKLPVKVQHRLAAGVLSAGHARALLALDGPEAQDALATRIVAEGMSVRATEEAVAMHAGIETTRPAAQRKRKLTAPALRELADNLSDLFDTRATVQLGQRKGKIVIEFASIDDLERIIEQMAPTLATKSRENTGD